MNTVAVYVYRGDYWIKTQWTQDVNEAMDTVHETWSHGCTAFFSSAHGTCILEPPIEDLVAQLSDCSSTSYDDSPAGHERRRINRHLP